MIPKMRGLSIRHFHDKTSEKGKINFDITFKKHSSALLAWGHLLLCTEDELRASYQVVNGRIELFPDDEAVVFDDEANWVRGWEVAEYDIPAPPPPAGAPVAPPPPGVRPGFERVREEMYIFRIPKRPRVNLVAAANNNELAM